jgi:outer membrane immunogenic protein
MKRLFVAGLAAAVFSGAPALAADMPVKAPYHDPGFSWTGCYIGAHAGGGWGVANPEAPTVADTKPQGFVGGGQVGCDYQASNWVLGVDGSFSGSGMHDQRTELFLGIPFNTLDTFETKIDWLASVTGRVGYAWDRWLVYGRGGAAWVRDRSNNSGTFFITTFNEGNALTRSGWTAGGGVEYAFARNWSFLVEYDFYGFGTKSATLSGCGGVGCGVPASVTFPLNQNLSVVKAGINFRFGSQ